jgi:glycosyltransferase involved in cell wall biosynthesis
MADDRAPRRGRVARGGPVRVLYVNHTASLGGGERSLIELLRGLPPDVSPVLACAEGELASAARALRIPVRTIPSATPSFRLAPVQTPRELVNVVRAVFAVRRAARHSRADLVHANSVRAGLIAAPLARLGGPPIVVHVRDTLPAGAAATLTRRVICSSAAALIANSAYTAASFEPDGSDPRMRTIHNAVDLGLFDPVRIDRAAVRTRLGLGPRTADLGVVAQITPWKGQDDAVRALAALRRRVPDARLLIVGSTKFATGSETFDNVAFERSLHMLVAELSLDGAVTFLGERTDVPEVLRALDLLLIPSWEEPFGRSLIEAMAMATPVLATSVGGPGEIVTDGVDGVLLPPRQPERWANAAASLLEQQERLHAMGEAGRQTALARFGRERHVRAVVAAYRDALGGVQH